MTEEKLKLLASQLAHPKGEQGRHLAELMNQSNAQMIEFSMDVLCLQSGDRVLEIGPGNGAHVKSLFSYTPQLCYTGLEVSSTMCLEAKFLSQNMYAQKKVDFLLYDGETIPFENGYFDKVFTVNTLYFWKDIKAFLREICRVLKPGGALVLTFQDKEFLETLPFTKYGFRTYSMDEIEYFSEIIGYRIVMRIKKNENTISKTGDHVLRSYTILRLEK